MIRYLQRKWESISDRCWPQARTDYYGVRSGTDTVVFVHGIFANGVIAWGRFPRLLATDPDLPKLDYLLWCYPTGCVARHNPLDVEGANLVGELQARVNARDDIFLVGHSMGGLIILRGLVDRIALGFAQEAPCSSVRWITLFASPLNGAWTAAAVRIVVGPLLYVLCMFRKHLKHLARGKLVDQLRTDTVHRVYLPKCDDSCNRKIPIRLILGARDRAVGEVNREFAYAMFRDPQPIRLLEDHSSIKLPADATDARYRALNVDLQNCQTRTFKRLCQHVTDTAGTTPLEREAVIAEILKRYGNMIRDRVAKSIRSLEKYVEAENEFLLLMAHYGAKSDDPPSDTANRAMSVLLQRRRKRR